MITKDRIEHSEKMGKRAVDLFIDACEAYGYKFFKTSAETDMFDHIDYFILRPDGTKTSVDIKGGNKIDEIWIEFQNVAGDRGWLYGEADLIAFDMPEKEGFYVVKRKDLLSLSTSIVENVFVSKQFAFRKLYQRNGRKDVLTKLHLDNILTIKNNFIPYKKQNHESQI